MVEVEMMKLQIETHDGITDVVEVEEYNALEVANAINDSQDEYVIVFGDNIYSKINIKTVKPLKDERFSLTNLNYNHDHTDSISEHLKDTLLKDKIDKDNEEGAE